MLRKSCVPNFVNIGPKLSPILSTDAGQTRNQTCDFISCPMLMHYTGQTITISVCPNRYIANKNNESSSPDNYDVQDDLLTTIIKFQNFMTSAKITNEQAVVRSTTNPVPCCHLANDTDLLTPVL